MIRLLPYYERPNRSMLLSTYFSLLAKALYFPDEDLNTLAVRYLHLSAQEAGAILKQRDRRRDRFQKATETHRVIWNSCRPLYDFLYTGGEAELDVDRLYQLLTVPMIEDVWKAKGMDFSNFFLKQDDGRDSLKKIFCYDDISRSGEIYRFTQLMGTEVCPYCNRIFISTVFDEEQGGGIFRPQIDHFKSQANYPFFALSILNWIPSCGICNQRKSFKTSEILYPYFEEAGENYRFYTSCKGSGSANYLTGEEGAEDSFMICGKLDSRIPDPDAYSGYLLCLQAASLPLSEEELNRQREAYLHRLEESARMFSWENAAQHHKGYVLKIYRRNHQFGKEYAASLQRSFHSLFSDLSLVYLSDIRQEHWGESPLTKLTCDIHQEIQMLQF